ncbi:MAG: BON domain-containing protein [Chloroflexota bacterium]
MAHELFRMDDDLPDAERHVLMLIRKTLLDYEPLRATRPVLEVSYRDGLVGLEGRVRTSAIKEIAELLVHRLPGVRAVRNDLVADPEVVRAVADALAADPELGPACPIVESRDGVVILVGTVPSDELAQRAVQVANAVPSIASVTSHLRVVPPAAVPSGNGSTNGAVAVATADDAAAPDEGASA